MALFEIFRGNEMDLPSKMTDGYAYFCVDTGSFFIDYTDNEVDLKGNLVIKRKKFSAQYADKLRYMENGEIIEIDVLDIIEKQKELQDLQLQTEKISETVTQVSNQITNVANALKSEMTGNFISVDDVSSIEHEVRVRVSTKNLIPFPYVTPVSKFVRNELTIEIQKDGGVLINGTPTKETYITLCKIDFGEQAITPKSTHGMITNTNNSGVATHYNPETKDTFVNVSANKTYKEVLFYPQLEYGYESTPYAPKELEKIKISRFGKNLIPYPYSKDYFDEEGKQTKSGITATDLGDGGVLLNGTATTTAFIHLHKTNIGNRFISGVQGKNGKFYANKYNDNIVTVHHNTNHLSYIQINAGTICEDVIFYPQIEVGANETEFEKGIEYKTYTSNADGVIEGLTSVSPHMNLFSNYDGATIDVTYNKDSNKEIKNLQNTTENLQNTTEKIESNVLQCSNALKGSVNGEVISITDVSPVEHNLGVKVLSKNLIPYPYATSTTTINGVTFTDNGDGSITVNGTNATEGSIYFQCVTNSWKTEVPIEAGTYILSGCPEGGSTTTYSIACGIRASENATRKVYVNNTVAGKIFTTDGGRYDIIINVYAGASLDNVVFKPQLEKGTTATPFAPFVDVSAATLSTTGKNLFGGEFEIGGIAGANGQNYNNPVQIRSNYINISCADYALSTLDSTYSVNAVFVYDANKTMIYVGYAPVTTISNTHIVGAKYARFRIVRVDGADITDEDLIKVKSAFQFEIGKSVTEYEPYVGHTYTVLSDGTVENVKSIYPNAILTTDTQGVLIECEYNKDINKSFVSVHNVVADAITETIQDCSVAVLENVSSIPHEIQITLSATVSGTKIVRTGLNLLNDDDFIFYGGQRAYIDFEIYVPGTYYFSSNFHEITGQYAALVIVKKGILDTSPNIKLISSFGQTTDKGRFNITEAGTYRFLIYTSTPEQMTAAKSYIKNGAWFQIEYGSTASQPQKFVEAQIVISDADGVVRGITSVYPITTIYCCNDSVSMDVTFNKSTGKHIEQALSEVYNNIPDGLITSAKRTKSGDFGLITANNITVPPIRVDTSTKVITISGGARSFIRASGQTVNIPENVELSMTYGNGYVIYDYGEGIFKLLPNIENTAGENRILILAYAEYGKFVSCPTSYSVDGHMYGIDTKPIYDIKTPDYEFIELPNNIGWWSDFVFVGDKLWVVAHSSDENHENTNGTIKIVNTNTWTIEKRLYHDFGHCNTVHYNKDIDALLIGNLPGSDTYPAALYILYDVSSWANLDADTTLRFAEQNPTIVDISSLSTIHTGELKGNISQVAACWGDNNMGQCNIVYVSTGFNSDWFKLVLGKGTNNLGNGTYSETESDKFNGTFISVWHSKFDMVYNANTEVIQGIDYHNGQISTSNGHKEIMFFKWNVTNKGISREENQIVPYNADGSVRYCVSEGYCIYNGEEYVGCIFSNETHNNSTGSYGLVKIKSDFNTCIKTLQNVNTILDETIAIQESYIDGGVV